MDPNFIHFLLGVLKRLGSECAVYFDQLSGDARTQKLV